MSILPVFSNQNIQSVLDRVKPVNPLKVFENFYTDRRTLYKEFKGNTTSYIYVIVNKLNGKTYVGSTRSMRNRVSTYFNLAHLAAQVKRPISSAMLKYGLLNFAFIVLVCRGMANLFVIPQKQVLRDEKLEQVNTNQHDIEVRETY